LIDFAFRGSEIEVAPFPLEPFSSYFAGNTVQICPVGALTSTPYRFKSRPWDLEQAESTCEGCAVGCRTVAQSSAGQLVRYLGVDVDGVNQSWLCDKGRYGFEAVHAENRLTMPLVRRDGILKESTWNEALIQAAGVIERAIDQHGPESVAFIGGARLTNEDAFAFAKLAKAVIGTDSVDAQLGDGLPAELVLGLPRATISEAANAKLIIVLGQDLREELPVLFLRLRQGAVAKTTSIIDLSSVPTSLRAYATSVDYLPGDLARAAALVASQPGVDALGFDQSQIDSARRAVVEAGITSNGGGLVVICGRGDLGESAQIVTSAATLLHQVFPAAQFMTTLRRANVHGALDMGLAPGILPGRVALEGERDAYLEAWGTLPSARGRDTFGILDAIVAGEVKVLVTLGADVLSDVPDRDLAKRALSVVPTMISLATHTDATTDAAHVVLPVAGEAERNGTVTNIEGRVAPTTQKVVPPGVAWPAWIVATEIARHLDADLGFDDFAAITSEIGALAPVYRGLNLGFANVDARRDGVVVPVGATPVSISSRTLDPMATPGIASVDEQGAPMQLGRTVEADAVVGGSSRATPELLSVVAGGPLVVAPKPDVYTHRLSVRRSLFDQGSLVQSSSSLAPLANPFMLRVHPHELANLGVTDGDLLSLRSSRTAFSVEVVGDATLDRRVVVLGARAENASGFGAFDLIDARELVVDVRLESI
jgi:NADH-quinone oxidoreductase subunit G